MHKLRYLDCLIFGQMVITWSARCQLVNFSKVLKFCQSDISTSLQRLHDATAKVLGRSPQASGPNRMPSWTPTANVMDLLPSCVHQDLAGE